MAATNPMYNDNAFKLGVFSTNADGGLTFTTVAERWRVNWERNKKVVQMADQAGLELILPLARWKGYGGNQNNRQDSYETLTFAAGVAAVTNQIATFSTVHVPLVHPVFAAKALMTNDHIGGGRMGLNIVCGWNVGEFDMFGHKQPAHDIRYDQGYEWLEIIQKIHGGGAPFDYKGQFYDLKGVVGSPGMMQDRMPIISAAFSPAGREFAAKTSDFLFTVFTEIDTLKQHIKDIDTRSAKYNREVGVFTTSYCVVRDTLKEAEEYVEYYAVQNADKESVDEHVRLKMTQSQSHESAAYEAQYRKRFAAGTGGYPLVGTPEMIVDEMIKLHKAGLKGTVLTFVDYVSELEMFNKKVLPLMEQAGLRKPAAKLASAAE